MKNIIIMKKKKFWYRPGWATAQVSLRLGWALGAGRAGAGHAGTAQAAWARGRGAHGRWGDRRWGAGSGRHGRAGRAGSWAGARTAGQQARGQGMDAQGRAAGAGRGARGGRLGGLCAPGVRSWARLGVLLHLTQFLAWFDSVFFPSHQMNTVHCEINFFLKNKNKNI